MSLGHEVGRTEEAGMPSRRDFIRGVAGTTAGMLVTRGGLAEAFAQAPPAGAAKRREVTIAGRRVKVIDIHAHAGIPEVTEVLKGTPLAHYAQGGGRLGPDRIAELDR